MTIQTDTVIQFSSLKSGGYDYQIDADREFFEGFENEEIIDGNVHFDIHLDYKERLMLFHISLKGEVTTTCDRCLSEMSLEVEGTHLLTVKVSDDETESDDEDVVFLREKETRIDLAQWLYEYVAIAIPMRHVHPDDANGQPTCDPIMLQLLSDNHTDDDTTATTDDHNDEIDPRWASLMQLKEPSDKK